MKSTKLLLITSEFPPQPGGIGNHAHNLAIQLMHLDWDVQVLTENRGLDANDEAVFDAQQAFPVFRIARRKQMLLSYLKRIQKAFSLAVKSDVVLVSGKFSLWTAGLLQLFLQRPFIAVIHGSEVKQKNRFLQTYTYYCLRKMDTVIGVSKFTLSLLEKHSLKKACVINNGFVIPSYARPATIWKTSKPLKLITVGNLTQRKGQHNVIAAIPALKRKFPDIEYHLVGIPTNASLLQQQAASLDVQDQIKIHGKVSEKKKWELLSEATIFIMLSEITETGDVEGFGIAILEANAVGLPAVGSLGCGIEDAIRPGYSGQLVPGHHVDAITTAVEKIVSDYATYAEQAQVWSKGFSWSQVGSQYHKVIMDLLEFNE